MKQRGEVGDLEQKNSTDRLRSLAARFSTALWPAAAEGSVAIVQKVEL